MKAAVNALAPPCLVLAVCFEVTVDAGTSGVGVATATGAASRCAMGGMATAMGADSSSPVKPAMETVVAMEAVAGLQSSCTTLPSTLFHMHSAGS